MFVAKLSPAQSILDSQLIWEYGKFQLARWSNNVALFSWNHPRTQPTTQPPAAHLFLTDPMTTGGLFWCAVSPPIGPLFRKYVRCPPPSIGTLFRKYVRCPPLPVYTFSVRCPPLNLVLCLEDFGSVLESEENWKSGKFQLARWSQAQLVSSSVALLAELVLEYVRIC